MKRCQIFAFACLKTLDSPHRYAHLRLDRGDICFVSSSKFLDRRYPLCYGPQIGFITVCTQRLPKLKVRPISRTV